MAIAKYNQKVFINCPFDSNYTPLLHAIVFTVYRCGFLPVTALDEDDGSNDRLKKILKCIADCKYGIHDISRTELNQNKLPRFNMPFELGLFFGAKKYGSGIQKNKVALIFEKNKYSYQQYLSDLNGIDTKAHNNNPDELLKKIRDWLTTCTNTTLPGPATIHKEYVEFLIKLPEIINQLGLDKDNLLYGDYCAIVENAIEPKFKKVSLKR
jgi:hypothetical protein